MVPNLLFFSKSPRLLLTVASVASQHVPALSSHLSNASLALVDSHDRGLLNKRDSDRNDPANIVFACLIPLLVLLSGVFAGLTLGYMSLDETQLNVLSISGTPDQKMYASKIKPIRKDGHLLLVTLLLANMITNETLPVISAPVLGGGVQSVIVSTVLIVIFAEIIPQSLCTRYGLYFGAKMAGPVRVLLWTLGFVAWPVAKLLELALGPHHGIIYRRAELKELIAMHSSIGEYGGDLNTDTVTIIGGALDLQEKVVKQAMTPIEDVFMLSIDAKLDYETLRKICLTGHSRIPVYEEIEVPTESLILQGADSTQSKDDVQVAEIPVNSNNGRSQHTRPRTSLVVQKVKKIVGILLVKQCVLLDPKDATPLRKIPLNKVPFVPNNEPLLGILDKFQEGRSHMAIVSRFSVEQAVSVKKAVKRGLTQRLLNTVGMGDSDSSSDSSDSEEDGGKRTRASRKPTARRRPLSRKSTVESDNAETLRDEGDTDAEDHDSSGSTSKKRTRFRIGHRKNKRVADVEMGIRDPGRQKAEESGEDRMRIRIGSLTPPRLSFGHREQTMPADAVLTKQSVDEFLQNLDPAIMPMGIITLEDVLEELIGEEIYDEFDPQGHPDLKSYGQNEGKLAPSLTRKVSMPEVSSNLASSSSGPAPSKDTPKSLTATPLLKPIAMPALKGLNFRGLGFMRPRSAPPIPRDQDQADTVEKTGGTALSVPEANLASESGCESGDESKGLNDQSTDPRVLTYDAANGSITLPLPAAILDNSSLFALRPKSTNTLIRAPVPLAATPATLVPPAGASHLLPTMTARSSSPSLEQAIRIERLRRTASGAASVSAPKGARFKSSPLTGHGDRSDAVIAERVRHDMAAELAGGILTQAGADDVRRESGKM